MSVKIENSITGAAMDEPLKPRYGRRVAIAAAAIAVAFAVALFMWLAVPRGLQASLADMRVATVESGMFRDDIALRAIAAPLHSVVLDSVESGRVEEVLARDGALVEQGELLFRLSNPQRRLELLARESDHAQQIANLSNLRVVLESGRSEHRRRMSDLEYALTQARKQHARNEALAQKGFISAAVLDESADRLSLQQQSFDNEKRSGEADIAIKSDAVRRMEQAIAGLETGLQLVHTTIDALAVRAPVEGRLTDFHLQVGETVKVDQRIGRIDDPGRFKLSAQVDEYYLSRIAAGRPGKAIAGGHAYTVTVSRVYPQVKEGRFTVELAFEDEPPRALNPGQGLETHIMLGDARAGLVLPNDVFLNDTGGSWVFVLDHDGGFAERRAVRLGRRNNSQVEVLSGLAAGERVIVSSYAGYGQAERLQIRE